MAYTLKGQNVWKDDKVCGLYKVQNNLVSFQSQKTARLITLLDHLDFPVAETAMRALRDIAQEQYVCSAYPEISSFRPYIQNTIDFCDEVLLVLQGN